MLRGGNRVMSAAQKRAEEDTAEERANPTPSACALSELLSALPEVVTRIIQKEARPLTTREAAEQIVALYKNGNGHVRRSSMSKEGIKAYEEHNECKVPKDLAEMGSVIGRMGDAHNALLYCSGVGEWLSEDVHSMIGYIGGYEDTEVEGIEEMDVQTRYGCDFDPRKTLGFLRAMDGSDSFICLWVVCEPKSKHFGKVVSKQGSEFGIHNATVEDILVKIAKAKIDVGSIFERDDYVFQECLWSALGETITTLNLHYLYLDYCATNLVCLDDGFGGCFDDCFLG